MKKHLNYALSYALLAMAGGVFYREFTKWNGFTGITTLGKVHTHLFLLGMIVYLLIALFDKAGKLQEQKAFCIFRYVYNIGLPLTVLMMLVRGIYQVKNIPLSGGMDAAISGIAGIGHILTGVGIILLINSLKKQVQ